MATKKLIALDIDDTQIPDRSGQHAYPGEEKDVLRLKATLENLSAQGNIVAHVTNGILKEFAPVQARLANPDYLSCAASTQIYKRDKDLGLFKLDEAHQRILSGVGYDPEKALAIGSEYPELAAMSDEHRSPYKVSFRFAESASPQDHKRVLEDLQKRLDGEKTMTPLFVAGNNVYFMDILPPPCVKSESVRYIAEAEGIAPADVIVFGNGNNDISMFRREFAGVAVGNSSRLLKEHVAAIDSEDNNSGRHIVAEGTRSQSVLNGLHRFGLTAG